MSCCNRKRRALSQPPAHPRPPPAPTPRNPTLLEHSGAFPRLIEAQATGTTYLFGPAGTPLAVDERDVADLVATGKFRLWSGRSGGSSPEPS